MSERRVVAVLGRGLVPADTPILRADDLGALRGDGIFETIRVWGGRPWLLAEHLARLARSAARLELAVPPEATLVDLVDQACSAWPRDAEGVLRLVCTRGPEDGGEVTAYATIAPVGEAILRARAEGVRVLTATLGVPATARPDAPWPPLHRLECRRVGREREGVRVGVRLDPSRDQVLRGSRGEPSHRRERQQQADRAWVGQRLDPGPPQQTGPGAQQVQRADHGRRTQGADDRGGDHVAVLGVAELEDRKSV